MAALGPTFDTSALIALEGRRQGMLEVVEIARTRRVAITVPANAVAEWWRGRSDRREYVLSLCIIQPVDEQIAMAAGEALAWFSQEYKRTKITDKVTIDATAIATAAIYGPSLYTGDIEDMKRLQPFFPSVRLFGLRPPA